MYFPITYTSPISICSKTDTDIKITINGGTPSYTFFINGIKKTPKSLVGNIATITITPDLYPTFTIKVTDRNGCTNSAAMNVKVDTPIAPSIDVITQPTCDLATGSVVLNNLPIGNWTINPGSINGSGTSTTISGLTTGIHSFTVTNSTGCVSAASAEITIDNQPLFPSSPVLNDKNLGCNQTSFVQDWASVPNATGYQLDVATDSDFTNYVSGFQDKTLGNVISETITGLSSVRYILCKA